MCVCVCVLAKPADAHTDARWGVPVHFAFT
jgi:hypothetical protein